MQDLDFSEYFYYDETSPSGLRRKIDSWSGKKRTTKSACKGGVAGSISRGYWTIILNGKNLRVHRIIMALHGHDIKNKVVDHIDGDSTNNKIDNLRLVTTRVNTQNSKMPKSNSSGVHGVTWTTSPPNKLGYVKTYAVAFWGKGTTRQYEYFSVENFGIMEALKLAVIARKNAIHRLNILGENYTSRHGI